MTKCKYANWLSSMLFQTSLLFLLSVSSSSSRPHRTSPKPDESRRNFRPSLQPTATLFASETVRTKTGTSLSARRSRTVSPAVPWWTTACFPEGGASKPSHDTSHSTGSQISITPDTPGWRSTSPQTERGFEELHTGSHLPESVSIL